MAKWSTMLNPRHFNIEKVSICLMRILILSNIPWSLLQKRLAVLSEMRNSAREKPREKKGNGGKAVSGYENFNFFEQIKI